MPLRIEAVGTARARRRFVELARRFRGGSPHYVPSLTGEVTRLLDPAKNPALRRARQRLWIASDERGPRGRIAATYDARHAESLGEEAGWFGFFDADSAATAAALLDTARAWLAEQGARTVLGPGDPDTNHECGCLLEGHDELPYLMMPHHPPQYGEWIAAAGFAKAKDLLAFETDSERMAPALARMDALADRAIARGGFRLVQLTKKHFDRQIRDAHTVYQEAWQANWGFLPMELDEFLFEAAGMKMLLDPRLAWLAYREERPVGVVVALPDANQALHAVGGRLFPTGILRLPFLLRRIDRVRTMMLGVAQDCRGQGLDLALVQRMTRGSYDAGYFRSEMSWVLEDNEPMLRLAERFGGRCSRRYRVYRAPASS